MVGVVSSVRMNFKTQKEFDAFIKRSNEPLDKKVVERLKRVSEQADVKVVRNQGKYI